MSIIKNDNKFMSSVQLFPNVITAFGLTCGLFIIFKMIVTDIHVDTEETLSLISFLFFLAAIADLLDGAVARLVHAESEFGILFDSFSDSITFGVAPSVVVLKVLSTGSDTLMSFILTISCVVFSLCGILRLVRYSMMAFTAKMNNEIDQGEHDALQKHFIGLPIPAAAASIMSLIFFLFSSESRLLFHLDHDIMALFTSLVMVIIGYFMISTWKFPSAKMLRFRVMTFQLVIATSVLAAMILYGMLHHFAVIFFICSWSYILFSWGLSIARLFVGKKSKTLEDFEPED